MKVAIKKHIDGMSENEIKDVFQRDYLRRLTRYRMTDDFYMKKYNMDFKSFEKARIVDSQNYSFEIELVLFIDNELFIQIYGNVEKVKLNLALVFKKRRISKYQKYGI